MDGAVRSRAALCRHVGRSAPGVDVRIAVLSDPAIRAVPEYDAGDVAAALERSGTTCRSCRVEGLACLDRHETDLVILPYVSGNLPEEALSGLVRFHAGGGSLLILGDIFFENRWYPMRNSDAPLLFLTRCHDELAPREEHGSFLTAHGKAILSGIDDPGYLLGKRFPSIRVKAFPPDICYPLFLDHSGEQAPESFAIVAIERKRPELLGARLAVVGFNGGQPRENVDGAYSLPWTYDPGLLNRQWGGIDRLVVGLVSWLEPAPVAGAIELLPLHGEEEHHGVALRIRSPRGEETCLSDLSLTCDGKALLGRDAVAVPAAGVLRLEAPDERTTFGLHHYELSATVDGEPFVLDRRDQGVLPRERSQDEGFGFSTYWSFRRSRVTAEYAGFCREMAGRGCQFLRANIPWEDVEPEPGTYVWSVPDGLIDLARSQGIALQFWMFPTTRGSGLSDGGVPWWVLREPAVDRHGGKGFFPSLWSPFYRERYFALIDRLTARYAREPALSRFVLDFGNSDFPYGYYYYYNDPSLFDYSPWERAAFARYLREEKSYDLEKVSELYGSRMEAWESVPVPYVEQTRPYLEYQDFRTWSIGEGMREVWRICRANAPDKTPPDIPGHGLGSIQDNDASALDAKARHWDEEQGFEARQTSLHNAGPRWGGEPWQVGGGYRQYDPHLASSLRYDASYFTIPGPDLGVDGEEITRIAFIRRSIMGASRPTPAVAVLDELGSRCTQSLCHVAVRLDQEVDLLTARHRYDFSCYRLLVLPPSDRLAESVRTAKRGGLLPLDEEWSVLLREAVRKGLNLLLFPRTGMIGGAPHPHLRRALGLDGVRYGDRRMTEARFPDSLGGGAARGMAAPVRGSGESVFVDSRGDTILLRRREGKGSILLAGFDAEPDSLDGPALLQTRENLSGHTLARICGWLGIAPAGVDSGQLAVATTLLRRGADDFLVLFSELEKPVTGCLTVRLQSPSATCVDLANGEVLPLLDPEGGVLELTILPRVGRYLWFTRTYP